MKKGYEHSTIYRLCHAQSERDERTKMEYRGLSLDRFQIEAIEALQADKSVLVAAPTGTGKTLVADWIVDSAMSKGQSVIYTAPIKALSNQKYRDYCTLLGQRMWGWSPEIL